MPALPPRGVLCRVLPAPALLVFATACLHDGGDQPRVATASFATVTATDVLTAPEVDAIIQAAAESIDALNMSVAVVDRGGRILRVWNRSPLSAIGDLDNRAATSLARTAAYLSHSQAPLTSRTMQFISTFHFPADFALGTFDPPSVAGSAAPTRPTLGVMNTGQGPLWQIDATNRGVVYAPFNLGQELPQLVNPDGSTPSPGLTALPGGVPLYKRTDAAILSPSAIASVERRLVGGVGVYISTDPAGGGVPLPEAAEFAAFRASSTIRVTVPAPDPAEDYTFGPVPPEGAVYLVGILLPFIAPPALPPGFGPGVFDGADVLDDSAAATPDPIDFLIGPRDSTLPAPSPGGAGLTSAEVQTLVEACVTEALSTHAAIRLPSDAACAMTIAVTDGAGEILALFRMADGTLFSTDIAIAKARESHYFSNPNSIDAAGPRAGMHPLAGIVPPGTAVTARTLGFLTQPFYPPGIDTSGEAGPLFGLVARNRLPASSAQMGFAPPGANQNGLTLFPGSAPLYRNGVLIGGIGVSGDGVEQDDLVTSRGIERAQNALGIDLSPSDSIRCDNFSFGGLVLPYFKFPQHPGG